MGGMIIWFACLVVIVLVVVLSEGRRLDRYFGVMLFFILNISRVLEVCLRSWSDSSLSSDKRFFCGVCL